MAKRFTDTTKWRNEWFRTLPDKAKLSWIYLCDECDKSGIIRVDWGLASFQLGFKVTPDLFQIWFNDKVHFISEERILVVQFFEFQYATSKDTWSVKIEAKKILETLGFSIVNNKIQLENKNQTTTVPPQCGDSGGTTLIRVRGRVSINNNKEDDKIFENFWAAYPRRDGKAKAIASFRRFVKLPDDSEALIRSATNYAQECIGKDPKFIKLPTTFLQDGYWREWVTRLSIAQPKSDLSSIFGKEGA